MTDLSALSRRTLLAGLGAGATLASIQPAWAGGDAIKHYIIIELLPGADQLSLDRWYMTYHAPQVHRAYRAWQRDYISFRSYLPAPEAVQRYGVKYGRMTEIHFDSLGAFRESRINGLYGGELDSFTPPPGGWRGNTLFKTSTATIPANPDTLYVSLATPPKETPYLRWIVFFRYPASVTATDGDAWFDQSFAKSVAALPGVKRFGRYNAVSERVGFPRVMELWFDDYAAWKAAFLAPATKLPASPGGSDLFEGSASMFVGENPDIDFIHDSRVVP